MIRTLLFTSLLFTACTSSKQDAQSQYDNTMQAIRNNEAVIKASGEAMVHYQAQGEGDSVAKWQGVKLDALRNNMQLSKRADSLLNVK